MVFWTYWCCIDIQEQYFNGCGLGLSVVPSHHEIVTYGKLLSHEFINDHLRKEGLMCHNRLPVPATDVSRKLKSVGSELVKSYPGLYRDVSKQLNITMTMETEVAEIFFSIVNELFKDGITWARIVAMFCIAASLSQDCLQYGNGLAINDIVQSMTFIIDTKLGTWIAQHGGWDDFSRHFRSPHETDALWVMMVVTCASVALVLIIFTDILAS
ncbi:bcl-2-related ovarian killer protein homolog B-like isoform X2 [Anneissia japonica]|uniref:bcl-2-related ovarian killer protein homolog B-like isoform X2 n=1 Tax=Anneissia japonica TaxID=1529436 RepID=UPI0014259B23|nr:bcl-2-related ovarian killer protein homolog B-like isoform X2 [Anneissia japonica]